MKRKPFLLQALSPLHAGTGQSADIIDLPIARMRATGIPFLPGSSLKGVLREACSEAGGGRMDKNEIKAVFGPIKDNADDHAGALSVSDARLLCLPVRSFRGTFAFVTSPLLLELASRDLADTPAIPAVQAGTAAICDNSVLAGGTRAEPARVWFEDVDLAAKPGGGPVADWAAWLEQTLGEDAVAAGIARRFAVVDDDTMTFLWETATQIDTRIALDDESRTVMKGALWVEESLPPETLLLGVLVADRSRSADDNRDAEAVLDTVLQSVRETGLLQVGGKATVGRGFCRLVPCGETEK